MEALDVRGVTMVRGTGVSFSNKLGILANRANTNGSVIISSVGTILNRHASGRLIHANSSFTFISTFFRGVGTAIYNRLRGLKCAPRSSNSLLVAEEVDGSNESSYHVGNVPTAISILRALNGTLIGVRNRRSDRSLLSPRRRCGFVSVLSNSSDILSSCGTTFSHFLSIHERLGTLATTTSSTSGGARLLRCRVGRLRRTSVGVNRTRTLGTHGGIVSDTRRTTGTCSSTLRTMGKSSRGPKTRSLLRDTLRSIIQFSRLSPRVGGTTTLLRGTISRVTSTGSIVNDRLSILSFSPHRHRRVRRQLSRLFELNGGCNSNRRGVLTCLSGTGEGLGSVIGGRRRLRGLGSRCSGTCTSILTTTRGLATLHGGATRGFTRSIGGRLTCLSVPGVGFAISFGGNVVSSTKLSGVRFLVSTGPNRRPGPLMGVTSNNRLSEVVLKVGDVLTCGSAISALVFSRVSANIDNETDRGVNLGLGRISGGARIVYMARSTRVTSGTSDRFLVDGSVSNSHAFADIALLGHSRHEGRLTEVVNKLRVASTVLGDTRRLLLAGCKG